MMSSMFHFHSSNSLPPSHQRSKILEKIASYKSNHKPNLIHEVYILILKTDVTAEESQAALDFFFEISLRLGNGESRTNAALGLCAMIFKSLLPRDRVDQTVSLLIKESHDNYVLESPEEQHLINDWGSLREIALWGLKLLAKQEYLQKAQIVLIVPLFILKSTDKLPHVRRNAISGLCAVVTHCHKVLSESFVSDILRIFEEHSLSDVTYILEIAVHGIEELVKYDLVPEEQTHAILSFLISKLNNNNQLLLVRSYCAQGIAALFIHDHVASEMYDFTLDLLLQKVQYDDSYVIQSECLMAIAQIIQNNVYPSSYVHNLIKILVNKIETTDCDHNTVEKHSSNHHKTLEPAYMANNNFSLDTHIATTTEHNNRNNATLVISSCLLVIGELVRKGLISANGRVSDSILLLLIAKASDEHGTIQRNALLAIDQYIVANIIPKESISAIVLILLDYANRRDIINTNSSNNSNNNSNNNLNQCVSGGCNSITFAHNSPTNNSLPHSHSNISCNSYSSINTNSNSVISSAEIYAHTTQCDDITIVASWGLSKLAEKSLIPVDLVAPVVEIMLKMTTCTEIQARNSALSGLSQLLSDGFVPWSHADGVIDALLNEMSCIIESVKAANQDDNSDGTEPCGKVDEEQLLLLSKMRECVQKISASGFLMEARMYRVNKAFSSLK